MRRRGFTLIELVSSLFVSSVVVLALASSISLATQALPDSSRPAERVVVVQRALEQIAADARFAVALDVVSPTEIIIGVPDRDGDGAADKVTYRWGGTRGDPLTRETGTLGQASLISFADSVSFSWAKVGAGAATNHPCLVTAIRVGTTEMTAEQRCLNIGSRE